MRLWVAVATTTVLLALTGCGSGNFSEKKSAESTGANVFKYPIVTSPTTLDPAKVQDGDTIDVIQQVFEGLVGWDENNKAAPRLAESFTVDDAGTTYTFKLKSGVKFHSGREVKAADFKAIFERAADPKTNSATAATYLSDIVGVREKLEGKATEVSGVKAVDDLTLTITIDKPRPYFIGKLTYPVAAVYDVEKLKSPTGEMTSIEEMVGTGPFIFDSFVPEQIIKLKANKDYHGGAPKLDGIERPVVKDAATRLSLYKNGQIDLVMLERQDIKALQEDPQFKDHVRLFDRPATWYLGMNCNMYPPLKDARVRRAIGMAINVDDIVNNTLGGINKRATGIVPPGVFGHRPDGKTLPFDPEAARKLLAEAGYPNGQGIQPFELSFREARPDIQLVAAKIATDLKQNLNITVNLKTVEWRAYLDKHNRSEIPFFHMRWGADYLDAENFLSTLLASYGPENKVNYKNPKFDELCRRADTSMDEAERLRLYAEAEDIVLQDAPFVPIYFQRDAELINPRVKGLRESIFGHLPHTTVTIEAANP